MLCSTQSIFILSALLGAHKTAPMHPINCKRVPGRGHGKGAVFFSVAAGPHPCCRKRALCGRGGPCLACRGLCNNGHSRLQADGECSRHAIHWGGGGAKSRCAVAQRPCWQRDLRSRPCASSLTLGVEAGARLLDIAEHARLAALAVGVVARLPFLLPGVDKGVVSGG